MDRESLNDLIFRYSDYDKPIHEGIRLQEDLHIYEERIIYFMNEFSNIFGVDISSLNLNKLINADNKNNISLTVGDLNRGIQMGFINNEAIWQRINTMSFRPKFSVQDIITGAIFVILIAALLCGIALYL